MTPTRQRDGGHESQQQSVRLLLEATAWIRCTREDPVTQALGVTVGGDITVETVNVLQGAARPSWADDGEPETIRGVVLDLRYSVDGCPLLSADVWLPYADALPSSADKWPLVRAADPAHIVDDIRSRPASADEAGHMDVPVGGPLLELIRTAVTLSGVVTEQVRLVLAADRVVLGHGTLIRRSHVL